MSAERVRRPIMDRVAPHRSFATILGQTGASSSPDHQPNESAAPPAADPIASGVHAAYQVIESYLREGQRAAQQYRKIATEPVSMGSGASDLQARSLQVWTDLVANWFDLLGVFTATLQNSQTNGRSVRLAYEVTSTQPARVFAQFHDGRETPHLASHGLRSLGSDACIDVAFDPPQGDGPVVVKIRVPDQQEPGLYTGALLHARDGSVVGSLTLQI